MFPDIEASSSIPHYPNRKVPPQLRNLIASLLSHDPKNRPSCEEILNSIGRESVSASQGTTNVILKAFN